MKTRVIAALALLAAVLVAPVVSAATSSGADQPSCEGEGPKKPDSPPKS